MKHWGTSRNFSVHGEATEHTELLQTDPFSFGFQVLQRLIKKTKCFNLSFTSALWIHEKISLKLMLEEIPAFTEI